MYPLRYVGKYGISKNYFCVLLDKSFLLAKNTSVPTKKRNKETVNYSVSVHICIHIQKTITQI